MSDHQPRRSDMAINAATILPELWEWAEYF